MADTSTPAELRETERRVLGNLPAYRTAAEHESAIASALEYGTIAHANQWPRSRTLKDLTARLAADRHCTAVDGRAKAEMVVQLFLDDLIKRGLVSLEDDEYRMTEAGLSALTA